MDSPCRMAAISGSARAGASPAPGGQLVGDRDLVYGLVAPPEGEAGLERPGVLLAEEVVGLEGGGYSIDRFGVAQEGGEDRRLRVAIMGRQLLRPPGLDNH